MSVINRVREVCEVRSLSLKQLSKLTKNNYRTVQNYLDPNMNRMPSYEFLLSLNEHIGISIDWLMTGQGSMYVGGANSDGEGEGFAPIPAHDWGAEAGPGSGFSDAAEFAAEKSLMFSRAWLRRKGLVEQELMVIGVRGDSMTPELEDGDAVLIDKRPVERPNQRGIYFLRTHDGLNLKRVRVDRRSGDCYLMSANPVYSDLIYSQEDIEILGLVVWRGTWVGG